MNGTFHVVYIEVYTGLKTCIMHDFVQIEANFRWVWDAGPSIYNRPDIN